MKIDIGDFVRFDNKQAGCWAEGEVMNIIPAKGLSSIRKDKAVWDVHLKITDFSAPNSWPISLIIGKCHIFGLWSDDPPEMWTRLSPPSARRFDGFSQSAIDQAKAVILMKTVKP